MGMLRSELTDIQMLLGGLDAAGWQRAADRAGGTVRDIVIHMIEENAEVARNGRLLHRMRLTRTLSRALTGARQRRQADGRASAPDGQLIAELGFWGRKAALTAPRRSRVPASILLPGIRLADDSADYLFRVVVARDAWLHRTDIAEAAGRPVTPGPHGAEIVRQAVRDVADAWSGLPVILEITGPAGGRWLAGDGAPVAGVCGDAVSYLRLISGRPAGHVEACGDNVTAAAFLAIRITL